MKNPKRTCWTAQEGYDYHQWQHDGQCSRCGEWMPGISLEARREMEEQDERLTGHVEEEE